MRNAITGFKDFIVRGNVVELAVAVVLGVAFNAVVQSLVKDLLTPLIGAIFGKPDFSSLSFSINGSQFNYGNFINALIAFISVAAAIYFFVILPLQRMKERGADEEPAVKDCPYCLSEIPYKATRCKACTAELDEGPAPTPA
jgi:large conductance mechanosensitive channel